MKENSVLVVGDVMMDCYIAGTAHRLSPEAPVPVVLVEKEFSVLGGAANVANNLAKLETPTALMGNVGKDSWANTLRELLNERNIEALLFESDVPTIVKTRVVSGNQQIVRYDRERVFMQENLAIHHLERILQNFSEGSFIIISDYGKGLCSHRFLQHLMAISRAQHTKVLIDPKGKNWEKYQNAWLVKPNLKELSDVVGEYIPNDNQAVAEHGKRVLQRFGLTYLLVTRSEKGMTLIGENLLKHYPAQTKEVFDISGAGDTVIAALTYALRLGDNITRAVQVANLAAGFVITKPYTYAISKSELMALLE